MEELPPPPMTSSPNISTYNKSEMLYTSPETKNGKNVATTSTSSITEPTTPLTYTPNSSMLD